MTARLYYWVTLGLLAILVLSVALVGRRVIRACHGIGRKTGVLLLLIVLAGVLLRFVVMPGQHNVFHDELVHLDMARAACERQVVGHPRIGRPGEEPHKYGRTKWCPGYHVLLSCWWHVAGVSEGTAFCLSRVLGSLSVVLAFLLGLLAFGDEKAGLWMGLLMAVYPLHVKFSSGTSLEVPSVFFLLLLLCVFVLYLREPGPACGFAVLAAAAYHVLIRPENLLLAGPLVLYVGWSMWKARPDWRRRVLLAAVVMLSLAPGIYHGLYAARSEGGWIGQQTSYPVLDNLAFWFVRTLHPVAYSLLAILGAVAWGWGRRSKVAGLLAACFLAYVLFYGLVHRSSFLGGRGDKVRFALSFSVIVIVGATAGIVWLTSRYRWAAIPVIGLLASSLALGGSSMVRPFCEPLEQEVRFVREAASCIPPNSLVFAGCPAHIRALQGVDANHWGFLFDPDARRDLAEFQRPIVLYVGVLDSVKLGGADAQHGRESTELQRRLRECGWQRTVLKSAQISGGEIGFYLLRPRDG